ncbi:MAG: hypothetical protein QXM88_02090 [Candidatus Nitrosocaldus sp.]
MDMEGGDQGNSTGSSSLFPHSYHEPRYTLTFFMPNSFNARYACAAL